jgi:hypothetical protein
MSIGAADMYWIVSTAFGRGALFAYFVTIGATFCCFSL